MADGEIETLTRAHRLQVANARARTIAAMASPGLPRAAMQALGAGRGRRRRDRRQALDAGARGAALSGGRRARHPAPRWPAARQCRSRLGRLRRGAQGGVEAGAARRVRAGAAESAPPGLGRGAQAQLPDEAADRGRHRRHHRPAARDAGGSAAATAPDAQSRRPIRCRRSGSPSSRPTPKGIVHIDQTTEVELRAEYEEPKEARRADVTYDDLGGLGDTIDQIREMVELPLRYPELFERLGVEPPKGVLLHGPPGTGKTRLARAVANESDAEFFHIAGPEIMGSAYGESEKQLREVFEQAAKAAPSIVFIDEIDSIAPKRGQVHGRGGEAPRRAVADADGRAGEARQPRRHRRDQPARGDRRGAAPARPLRPRDRHRRARRARPARDPRHPHARHAARRQGRSRRSWRAPPTASSAPISRRLCREAAIEAVRRIMPRLNLEERTIPPEVLDELSVTREDFLEALKRVQPSAMREVMVQAPNVGWDDVGGARCGAREAARGRRAAAEEVPDAFRRLGIRPAKGFLLYGPPGTGKTLLAKAVAREAEANFIATKSCDLLSKWYGESEQQIARLFARARQVAPTVIFIDELDSLVPARGGGLGEPAVTERVVNTILSEMDGLEELQSVVVIGATNRPNLIDPALLRPGRFDELVYVGRARRRRTAAHPRHPCREDAARGRCRSRRAGRAGPSASPAPISRTWRAGPGSRRCAPRSKRKR